MNLVSAAAVLTIQYVADPNSALRILRWMIGTLDAIGVEPWGGCNICYCRLGLVLLALSRQLNLIK